MEGVRWSELLSGSFSLVTEDGDATALAAAGVSAAGFVSSETYLMAGERGPSVTIAGTDFFAARTLTVRRLAVVPSFESIVLRGVRVGRRTLDGPTLFFFRVLPVGPDSSSGMAVAATVVTSFVRLPAVRTVRVRLRIGALFGFIPRFRLGGRGCF